MQLDMSKPAQTSKKQLLWIFIILAIVCGISGILAPGMFTIVSWMGIFYVFITLVFVQVVAWFTDKWDNFWSKKKKESNDGQNIQEEV